MLIRGAARLSGPTRLLTSTSRTGTRVPVKQAYASTLSSVEGPVHPPLAQGTLSDFFDNSILPGNYERPALISRQEAPRSHGGPVSRNLGVSTHLSWDYEEFDMHIRALARGLLKIGVRKGDRVAVIMGNNSSYAMLQWACASIGAILVTINPAYRMKELVTILRLTGVRHLFITPALRTSKYPEMLRETLPSLKSQPAGNIQEEALPDLQNVIMSDNASDPKDFEKNAGGLKCIIDWREVLLWREDNAQHRELVRVKKGLHQDEVMNLQMTSGTTGLPKAVSLSHHNLLNNGLSIGRCMNLTASDVATSHRSSIVLMRNLAAWTHGACIVYPSPSFDPPSIVDAVVQEKCTALHGVPTHFLGVLAEVEKRKVAGENVDTARLRTGIAAGSPVPIELMRALGEKINLKELTNAYGMTETSPVSFQTTTADPFIKRVETVGKIQPHVKAKIVDPNGYVVPIGQPGELLVAGYLLQRGYWNNEEQTKAVMKRDKDGMLWMHTGDEAILDEEGYLRIVGRIKDIIIRGGENLFPVVIENALTNDPDVLEAAAVSVQDDRYGEVVGAYIARRPGTRQTREQIRQSVRSQMNPQNAPSWVWFLGEDGVPDELPKTGSGKVQKHVLRERSEDLRARGIGRVDASSK